MSSTNAYHGSDLPEYTNTVSWEHVVFDLAAAATPVVLLSQAPTQLAP